MNLYGFLPVFLPINLFLTGIQLNLVVNQYPTVVKHSVETIDFKCLPLHGWANFGSGDSYLKVRVMHTLLCRIIVGEVWWGSGFRYCFYYYSVNHEPHLTLPTISKSRTHYMNVER